MFARTAFVGPSVREALLVPRQALIGSIREPKLFIITRGRARLRTVVAGQEIRNSLEILEGVAPGDSVVTSGQNEISDGMPVSIVRKEVSPGS
jgi:hypothetical protein